MATEQVIANLVTQVEVQSKNVERVADQLEKFAQSVQGIVKPLQDMTKSFETATRNMVALAQKNFGEIDAAMAETQKKLRDKKLLDPAAAGRDADAFVLEATKRLKTGFGKGIGKVKIDPEALGLKEYERQVKQLAASLVKDFSTVQGDVFGEIEVPEALIRTLNLTKEEQQALRDVFKTTQQLNAERQKAQSLEAERKRLQALQEQLAVQRELVRFAEKRRTVSGAAAGISAQAAVQSAKAQEAGNRDLSLSYGLVSRQAMELKKDTDVLVRSQEGAKRKAQEVGQSHAKTAEHTLSLQKGMENLTKSTQLALGPLSGVAARITALTSLFKQNVGALAALVAGFTAGIVGFSQAVAAGSRFEQQMLKIQGVLVATGNPLKTSADEINRLSVELAEATLTSTDLARQASAVLLTFKGIGRDAFRETLFAAQGLASLTGTGLLENIRRLARALQDPVRNLGALSEAGVQFTVSQEAAIKRLQALGRTAEAQEVIFERLKFATEAATAEAGGYAGALDTLIEKTTAFFEALNKALGITDSVGKIIRALTEQLSRLTQWFNEGGGVIESFAFIVRKSSGALVFFIEHIKEVLFVLGGLVLGRTLGWFAALVVNINKATKALVIFKAVLAGLGTLTGRALGGLAGALGGVLALIYSMEQASKTATQSILEDYDAQAAKSEELIDTLRRQRQLYGAAEGATLDALRASADKNKKDIEQFIRDLNNQQRDLEDFIEGDLLQVPETAQDRWRALRDELNDARGVLQQWILDYKFFQDLASHPLTGEGQPEEFGGPSAEELEKQRSRYTAIVAELGLLAKEYERTGFLGGPGARNKFEVARKSAADYTEVLGKAASSARRLQRELEELDKEAKRFETDPEEQLKALLALFGELGDESVRLEKYYTALTRIEGATSNLTKITEAYREQLKRGLVPEDEANRLVNVLQRAIQDPLVARQAFIKIFSVEAEARELDKILNLASAKKGTAGGLIRDIRDEMEKLQVITKGTDLEFQKLENTERLRAVNEESQQLVARVAELVEKTGGWDHQVKAVVATLKAEFPGILEGATTYAQVMEIVNQHLSRLQENSKSLEDARIKFNELTTLTKEAELNLRDFIRENERNLKLFQAYSAGGAQGYEDALNAIERADAVENARKFAGQLERAADSTAKMERLADVLDRLRDSFPQVAESTKDLRKTDLPAHIDQLSDAMAMVAGQGHDWKKAFEDAGKAGDTMAQQLKEAFQGVGQSLLSTIDDFVDTGIFKIQDFINAVLKEFLRLLLIRSIIDPLFNPKSGFVSLGIDALLKGGAAGAGTGAAGGGGGFINTEQIGALDIPLSPSQGTLRGLTASSAAPMAGPVDVTVIDQRATGASPEISQTTNASGRQVIKVLVRDELTTALSDGSQDTSLALNYGVTRKAIRR